MRARQLAADIIRHSRNNSLPFRFLSRPTSNMKRWHAQDRIEDRHGRKEIQVVEEIVRQSVDSNVGYLEISQDIDGKKEALVVDISGEKTFSLSAASFKDTFSCLGDLLLVTFIRCVTSIYVHDIDIYIYIYVYNMCWDSVIFSVDKFDKFSCYSIDRCNGGSRLFSRCEPRG